jgi:predicted secreted hydrolase
VKKIVSKYQDSDDAVHPFDSPNYYEWWYLDAIFDNGYSCTLSCFWRTEYEGQHIPMIIIDLYPPEGERIRGNAAFDYKDCRASLEKCDVKWGDNYIVQEGDTYKVHLRTENIGVDLTYKRKVPGWKWTSNGLVKNDTTGKQGWVNAIPRAEVTGNLLLDGKIIPVRGDGYHDKNWGDVDMSHSYAGWGWGRMYDSKYTFIYGWFMPLITGDPIIPSLFVARDSEIIFASPAIKFTMGKEELHNVSGIQIPTQIQIQAISEDIDINCRLDIIKILEYVTNVTVPGGSSTNYFRRLNKYNARIKVGNSTDEVSGQALNEYVLLR